MRDPKLTITVKAAGKRISETNVPETLQATAVQSVRAASDLQLIAQGLYYSNPFGSTGPMPPKANSETTYAIGFSLTTWRPACATRIAWRECNPLGVASTTTSTSHEASSASSDA